MPPVPLRTWEVSALPVAEDGVEWKMGPALKTWQTVPPPSVDTSPRTPYPPTVGEPGFHGALMSKLSELAAWLLERHEEEVVERLWRAQCTPGQAKDVPQPSFTKSSPPNLQPASPDLPRSSTFSGTPDVQQMWSESSPSLPVPPSPKPSPIFRKSVSFGTKMRALTSESDRGIASQTFRPSLLGPGITDAMQRQTSDQRSSRGTSRGSALDMLEVIVKELRSQSEVDHPTATPMPQDVEDKVGRNDSMCSVVAFADADISSTLASSSCEPRSSLLSLSSTTRQFKLHNHWTSSARTLKELQRAGRISLTLDDHVTSEGDYVHRMSSLIPLLSNDFVMNFDKLFVRIVFHPSGRSRMIWTSFNVLLFSYDFVSIPLDVFFETAQTLFSKTMLYVVAVFLSLDVLFSLVTGKYSGASLMMSFRLIMSQYAKTSLLPDLVMVTATWLDLARVWWGWQGTRQAHAWIRSLRLLRIFSLLRQVHVTLLTWWKHWHTGLILFNDVLVLLLAVFCSLHLLTCVWYGIGHASDLGWARDLGSDSIGRTYIFSFNSFMSQILVQQSMLTGTVLEGGYIGVLRVIALFVFSWFIAQVTLLAFNLTDKHALTIHLTCSRYLMKKRISNELSVVTKRTLATQLRKMQHGEQVTQEAEMFLVLPENLQSMLHEEARGPVVTRHFHLLNDLKARYPRIVRQLCHKAISNVQGLAGDNIFDVGDQCSCMFFIDTGYLNYTLGGSDSEKPMESSRDIHISTVLGRLEQPQLTCQWQTSTGSQNRESRPSRLGGMSGSVRLHRGRCLSEAALWTTWIHYGNLCAFTDCIVLSLDVGSFFNALPDASVLLHVTLYAQMFVKLLNELPESAISDLAMVVITKDNLQELISAISEKSDDKHLVFLSHYKVEAGTEATLMQEALERMLQETSHAPDISVPVFVDSENLADLSMLRQHVKESYNLVLLLTPGVLSRPWCLVEIVTALDNDVNVVPVEVQRPGSKFQYPDEAFYKKLHSGKYLSNSSTQLLKEIGIEISQVEDAIRQVFMKIALPFSPHKTANVRHAELVDILQRCLQNTRLGPMSSSTSASLGLLESRLFKATRTTWGREGSDLGLRESGKSGTERCSP